MNLPAFVTPNFITVLRVLFVPVGAYTLFKNGGDDPTWQYISWCVFFILGMSDVLDGNLARSRTKGFNRTFSHSDSYLFTNHGVLFN